MIISFQHKFIFIAVPKTATHAIRVTLRPYLDAKYWEQAGLLEKHFFPVQALAKIGHGHIAGSQIQPFLLPGMWAEYFKFCFVRNPYDRFISGCYFYNRENRRMHEDPLGRMKQFIQSPEIHRSILFHPQHTFIYDEDENPMVDYIGKFESLQEHFDKICCRIDFPTKPLPQINQAQHPSFKTSYDQELLEMVQQYYASDFRLLNYSIKLSS